MLSVIYFLSLVSIGMNREIFILPTLPTMYYYAFLASIFCVVFVTAYSLITVIDAYFAKANKVQTFDLKLSQRFKNHLLVFENTFIVGWTSFALFLLSPMRNGPIKIYMQFHYWHPLCVYGFNLHLLPNLPK
jgi:hypothetical protein